MPAPKGSLFREQFHLRLMEERTFNIVSIDQAQTIRYGQRYDSSPDQPRYTGDVLQHLGSDFYHKEEGTRSSVVI